MSAPADQSRAQASAFQSEPVREQANGIVVRSIPFAFEENLNPAWHPTRSEWSHMANGASLTMPYLEPFLIRTVREALQDADSEALRDAVRGFVGQEAQHFQNHRKWNEILKRRYPELAEVEAELEADYQRFQGRSLRWRLAYTAGFETMTMGVTEWLIGDRRLLFENADPSVSSLILWHMVEETEHKNVAFDVYQSLYGDYWPRVWGLLVGSWHIAWSSRKGYTRMLRRDGLWRNWRSRLRLYGMVARFLVKAAPAMLRSLLPGYHPSRVDDPKWVARWASAYADLPEDRIPLLDTSDPDIPARFI